MIIRIMTINPNSVYRESDACLLTYINSFHVRHNLIGHVLFYLSFSIWNLEAQRYVTLPRSQRKYKSRQFPPSSLAPDWLLLTTVRLSCLSCFWPITLLHVCVKLWTSFGFSNSLIFLFNNSFCFTRTVSWILKNSI